jgi:hypothetical protein
MRDWEALGRPYNSFEDWLEVVLMTGMGFGQ